MRNLAEKVGIRAPGIYRHCKTASLDDYPPAFGGSGPMYNLQAEYAVLHEGMQKAIQELGEEVLSALTVWILATQANGEIDRKCEFRTRACLVHL